MFVETYDVIVLGGGAAGLMAAGIAAQNGRKTILIEKNPVLGKKLLITGKGRCNLTNYCDVSELLDNIPRNNKFLINAFHRFNSYDTINFFSELELPAKVERGNRVFPDGDQAKDVVKALIKFISSNHVTVHHKAVESVMKFGSLFAAKLINGEVIRAEKLILATGGKSYPGTGSTGDGYKFARAFGHKTSGFKPSLVPIEAINFIQPCELSQSFAMVRDKDQNDQNLARTEKRSGSASSKKDSAEQKTAGSIQVNALQGLSLKNVSIKIFTKNGKEVYQDFGEMLFTHFGVSGPIILSISAHLEKLDDHMLCIDLKPALTENDLDLRLQREFLENSQKQIQNVLKNLLPAKMISVFIALAGIPAAKKAGQLTRPERKKILALLKNFSVRLEKYRPIQEAIITRGGVDVKQINPQTMESKLVPGLFFAGEIIDVDGYTGGFNLQIAWSTGFCAGSNC